MGFRGQPGRFVEQSDPQFQEVVSKCYAGFRVEGPETFNSKVLRVIVVCGVKVTCLSCRIYT